MRKLLAATTALALVGTGALAEISITGTAELGIDYDSDPNAGVTPPVGEKPSSKFVHEVGIDFAFSGTTDGGLTFSGKAGFDTGDDTVNEGTVSIGGSWGTLTFGENDSADLVAGGIADVGMNGVGVDDVAEGLRGQTANEVRYDNTFGQVSFAISAGSSDGTLATAAVTEAALPQRSVGYSRLAAGWNHDGDTGDDATAVYPAGTLVFGPFSPTAAEGASVRTIPVGSVSAGTPATASENEFAVGMKFTAGTMNFGLGYAAGAGDVNTTSVGVGFATGQLSGNLFWSANSQDKIAPAIMGTTGRPAYEPGTVNNAKTWYDERRVAYDSTLNYAAGLTDPATVATPVEGLFVAGDTEEGIKLIDTHMAKHDVAVAGAAHSEDRNTIGVDVTYTIGASKLTLSYARLNIENEAYEIKGSGKPDELAKADGYGSILNLDTDASDDYEPNEGRWDNHLSEAEIATYNADESNSGDIASSTRGFRDVSHSAFGIGVTHDLGGGATLNAGFGSVPQNHKIGANTMTKNKASVGVTFKF